MAGKSVLSEEAQGREGPCRWFLVGGDLFSEEGMKSWRRER